MYLPSRRVHRQHHRAAWVRVPAVLRPGLPRHDQELDLQRAPARQRAPRATPPRASYLDYACFLVLGRLLRFHFFGDLHEKHVIIVWFTCLFSLKVKHSKVFTVVWSLSRTLSSWPRARRRRTRCVRWTTRCTCSSSSIKRWARSNTAPTRACLGCGSIRLW